MKNIFEMCNLKKKLIKSKVKCSIFLVILLALFVDCKAQDSLKVQKSQGINPFIPGLRTSIGYQRSAYFELGASWLSMNGDIVGPSAYCFYGALRWIPTINPQSEKNIIAPNIGFLMTGHVSVGGLELSYLSDLSGRKDILITPKIGMGFWGMVNILYGYSFSPNGFEFSKVGRHQFSIEVNWARYSEKNKKYR
ncbi:MAG: hypothetical protein ACPGSD_02245 [Flavobacteriales bacterium]